jgi:hypothetical protein
VCPLHQKSEKRHEKDKYESMDDNDAPGPKMTAFQSMMLSGHGLPEIPPGGSLDSRLKSRMRRLLQLVDYDGADQVISIDYTEGWGKNQTDHDGGYG